jgi:hypothetical protein
MQAFLTAALRLAKQQKALDETAIEGFLLFPERASSERATKLQSMAPNRPYEYLHIRPIMRSE